MEFPNYVNASFHSLQSNMTNMIESRKRGVLTTTINKEK